MPSLRYTLGTLLCWLIASQPSCPSAGGNQASYSSTTGLCYFIIHNSGGIAGSNALSTCQNALASSTLASIADSSQASIVLGNECRSLTTRNFWIGLYLPAGPGSCNSGGIWQWYDGTDPAYIKGSGASYWGNSYPNQGNSCSRKCVYSDNKKMYNDVCTSEQDRVCCQATPLPTPSGSNTPSNSRTASNSRSATPSRTASRTRSATATMSKSFSSTPSNTPSRTASPSVTRSPSATVTNTATQTQSRSITPTNTVSSSQTPTASVTASVTPSETRTPTHSRTASATRSASKTQTGTPSLSISLSSTRSVSATASGTWTSTGTQTSTATVSMTMTVTATTSATSTVTATTSASSTVTRSASGSITATTTGSSTATVTRSATATTTPLALRVTELTQWNTTGANGEEIAMIGLRGEGYRLYLPGAVPTLDVLGYSFSNITAVSESYIEAELPIAAMYWSNAAVTLRVLQYSYTFVKPNVMPAVEAMSLSPATVPFASRLTITAPYIANATDASITLLANGETTLCAEVVRTSSHSLTCVPTAPREAAFGVSSAVNLQFQHNSAAVLLPNPLSVALAKPVLAFPVLPPPKYRVGARSRTRASALMNLTSSAAWIKGGVAAPVSVLESSVLTGVSFGHYGYGMSPLGSMSNAVSFSANFSVSTAAPIVAYVSPSFIQWPAQVGVDGIAVLTFVGLGFGSPELPRILSISVGDGSCNTTVLSSSVVECRVLISSIFDGAEAPSSVAVQMTWGDAPFTTNISPLLLKLRKQPTLLSVVPTIVTPGQLITVTGTNLQALNCFFCDGSEPSMEVGGLPCTILTVLSDEVATCVVPTVPLSMPGYPRVNVTFTNAAGQAAPVALSMSFTAEVTLSWKKEWLQPQCAFPSGTATILPFDDPPTLRIAGSSVVRCYLEAVSNTAIRAGLVGSNAVSVEVGRLSSVEDAAFGNLGIQAASNASGALIGHCVSDQGARLITNSSLPFRLPRWNLAWTNAPVALDSYVPTDNLDGNASFVVGGCDVSGAIQAQFSSLLSCQLGIVKSRSVAIAGISLRQLGSLAVSGVSASLVRVNSSYYKVSFPHISLQLFDLGVRTRMVAMCEWLPTGEALYLPPVNIGMVSLRVAWGGCNGFPRCSNASDGVHVAAFPGISYPIRVILEHDIPVEDHGSTRPACTLLLSQSNGLRLLTAATTTISLDLRTNSTWDTTVGVSGDSGEVQILVECVAWERKVRSPLLFITPLSLQLAALTPLPEYAVLGTTRLPTAQLPLIQLSVLDNGGIPAAGVECSVATSTQDVRLVSSADSSVIVGLQPVAGVLNITGAAFIAEVEVPDDLQMTAVVNCAIPGMESPAILSWLLRKLSVRLTAPTLPKMITDSNGLVPPIQLTISPINASDPAVLAAWQHTLQDPTFRESFLCRASAAPLVAELPAFLSRAAVSLDGNGVALFDKTVLLGRRGGDYNVSFVCAIDWMQLPAHPSYLVQILPCVAGTEPSGVTCDPCSLNHFSLGQNEDKCIECPYIGAVCNNGILKLLQGYYRPPEQSSQAFGPDMELHVCFNEVACVLNETTFQYGCRQGYKGPLCGVCDADDNYGAFGRYCEKCWPDEASQALFAIIGVAFVALLAFIAFRDNTARKGMAPIVIRITMGYIQALGCISALKASVAANYGTVLGWSDSVSDSPFMSGPAQCMLEFSLLQRYVITISVPLVAFLGTICVVAIVFAVRAIIPKHCVWDATFFKTRFREWFKHRRHVSALGFFAFMMYMPIVKMSINVLGCTEQAIDGVYRVRLDLSAECANAEHVILRIISFVVLAVYGVGFPFVLWYVLTRKRSKGMGSPTLAALSFLYDGYRTGTEKITRPQRLIWWESIVLVRKAGLIVISVLITNAFSQVVGSILLLSAFLLLQQQYQPYVLGMFNNLETIAVFILFVTAAIAGMVIPTAVAASAAGRAATVTGSLRVATTLMMVLNAIFAAILVILIGVFYVKDMMATQMVSKLVKTASSFKRRRKTEDGTNDKKEDDNTNDPTKSTNDDDGEPTELKKFAPGSSGGRSRQARQSAVGHLFGGNNVQIDYVNPMRLRPKHSDSNRNMHDMLRSTGGATHSAGDAPKDVTLPHSPVNHHNRSVSGTTVKIQRQNSRGSLTKKHRAASTEHSKSDSDAESEQSKVQFEPVASYNSSNTNSGRSMTLK